MAYTLRIPRHPNAMSKAPVATGPATSPMLPPTPWNDNAIPRLIKPEEVAAGIFFLCSDEASAITGVTLPIDCGYLAAYAYRTYPA